MKKWTRTAVAILGGSALAFGAATMPAGAATQEDKYPETPVTNADLPIINTHHGSDHIKANVLNPHPVCNPFEDYRTVVYQATDKFLPVGTISTDNQTTQSIPLTQDLSKTQTITMTVNGSQTQTTGINAGGTGSGDKGSVNAGISYELAKTIGGEASYSLSWNVGQKIGPYDVPAGHTGEATYGFRAITMTGTQQHCKANGTWSNPAAWRAFAPIKNDVKVKLYENPVDSRIH